MSLNQVLEDLPGQDIEDITRVGNNKEAWREITKSKFGSWRQKPNHDGGDQRRLREKNLMFLIVQTSRHYL